MADEFRFLSASPLAARMRPKSVGDVVGQEKVLGPGSALRRLVEATAPVSQSIILWGPPGTGKTTLANLIASASGLTFKELSAVNAGVKDTFHRRDSSVLKNSAGCPSARSRSRLADDDRGNHRESEFQCD
jgi:replication-associated recombination protein RarA